VRPIVLNLNLITGQRIAVNLQYLAVLLEPSPKAHETQLQLSTGTELTVQGDYETIRRQIAEAVFQQGHDNLRD
jgi:hypothetical protein